MGRSLDYITQQVLIRGEANFLGKADEFPICYLLDATLQNGSLTPRSLY